MSVMRVGFHWSGGKDSALALGLLLDRDDVEVDRLVTTVHADSGESTVHEIPGALLEAQARSIGLPLHTVAMPGPGLMGYVEAMNAAAAQMRREGIDAFGFGDLSSSGLLDRKQRQFAPLGLGVLQPLGGLSSRECIERFLISGTRAMTVVVDASVLDRTYVGVEVDREFVARLPEGIDVCGELGEYHSFVYDGPLFAQTVDFALSPVRDLSVEIGTTDGPRTYDYLLATPRAVTNGAEGEVSQR